MIALTFSSTLPAAYYDDLENLIFFNGQQGLARRAIVESLERFGEPRIVCDDETVRVAIARCAAQCVFALAEDGDLHELAGIVVFLRTDFETLHVVHLAVADGFSGAESPENPPLVLSLVQEVRRIAGRLHGVRRVTLMSGQGRPVQITIRPDVRRSTRRSA